MPNLEWSDALALGLPVMDETHHEFVDLLASVESGPDTALVVNWRALVNHTQDHFSREDHWMKSTRFSSTNCHTVQHQVVLGVMREGLVQGESGQLHVIRHMASELGQWFVQHAQTMDAALALHLRSVGYDPATGLLTMPEALPQAMIQGCGSASCGSPAVAARAAVAA